MNNIINSANSATLSSTPGQLIWDQSNNIVGVTTHNGIQNISVGPCSSSSTWATSGYVSIDDTEFITSDIPSIFTISKITIKSPKVLLIQYTPINSKLCPLAPEGNIYISGAKVFGVYNHNDNFYWNYQLVVEFENEEDVNKITVGNTFTNATQWEKKLSVTEIINMLENKDIYYRYIHSKVEESVKYQLLQTRIDKHRSIDKLYGFEE